MNSERKIKALNFFVGGYAAGFISLVIASLTERLFSENGPLFFYVLVLLEEIIKFFCLLMLLTYNQALKELPLGKLVLFAVFFGIGFGFFEITLIYFNQQALPLRAFLPAVVHIITSILLAISVKLFFHNKKSYGAYFLILLAIAVHLCYNVLVITN